MNKAFTIVCLFLLGIGNSTFAAEFFSYETDNYAVKTNVSTDMARKVAEELEMTLNVYRDIFPSLARYPEDYNVIIFNTLEQKKAYEKTRYGVTFDGCTYFKKSKGKEHTAEINENKRKRGSALEL